MQRLGWIRYLLYSIAAIVATGVVLALVLSGYSVPWTGFGNYTTQTGETVRGKTLWDWLELLIIPLVLAGGAILLNRSERTLERKTAEDRAKLEREIATDRQQEAALQSYFDRMTELLIKEKLLTTKKKEVRDVARTRTLNILRTLDAIRKGLVVRFLEEAELIKREERIINLEDADLSSAGLSYAILFEVNLIGANLHHADLRYAYLNSAKLIGANLAHANLSNAQLYMVDLRGANLQDADLRNAKFDFVDLREAVVTEAQLGTVYSLRNAILPDGTKHE